MVSTYYEDYPTNCFFWLIKNSERGEDTNLRLSINFILKLIVLSVSPVSFDWFDWVFTHRERKKRYTLHFNYLSNQNYSNQFFTQGTLSSDESHKLICYYTNQLSR